VKIDANVAVSETELAGVLLQDRDDDAGSSSSHEGAGRHRRLVVESDDPVQDGLEVSS
jgi:hypothetical protein